ncbi:LapA family protein [Leptolyngbya sp. BC1307]|uniref:LapA family protein n=1 Tax=Leptolyngbya sp. BC1307 TaxID=2029589 RepID=UPI000EFD78AC|nr:LapA family protein [Leptolyngbya sp. BC1307]
MPLLIVAAIAIAFLAIAFALVNNQPVIINLLIAQVSGSLALVLLSTLAIGVLIGLLVITPALIKRGWRVSRAKKQTTELEEQLSGRDRDLTSQTRNTDRLRQSHENLLLALKLTDPGTGLINAEVLPQTLSALIQQMKLQPGNPQFNAIGLLIVDAKRQLPIGAVETTARQNAQLDQAIAAVIRQSVTLDTWLYCDSRDENGAQFMCVLTGMDKTGLKQYGETLQSSLTEEPLTLADGSVVAVDAKVGGAIADKNHPTNREQIIIDKAYQALAEAGKHSINPIKGSSPVKIVQVTDT